MSQFLRDHPARGSSFQVHKVRGKWATVLWLVSPSLPRILLSFVTCGWKASILSFPFLAFPWSWSSPETGRWTFLSSSRVRPTPILWSRPLAPSIRFFYLEFGFHEPVLWEVVNGLILLLRPLAHACLSFRAHNFILGNRWFFFSFFQILPAITKVREITSQAIDGFFFLVFSSMEFL